MTEVYPPGTDRPRADARLAGAAVPLYLTLWNRSADDSAVEVSNPAVLEQWRSQMRVT